MQDGGETVVTVYEIPPIEDESDSNYLLLASSRVTSAFDGRESHLALTGVSSGGCHLHSDKTGDNHSGMPRTKKV